MATTSAIGTDRVSVESKVLETFINDLNRLTESNSQLCDRLSGICARFYGAFPSEVGEKLEDVGEALSSQLNAKINGLNTVRQKMEEYIARIEEAI